MFCRTEDDEKKPCMLALPRGTKKYLLVITATCNQLSLDLPAWARRGRGLVSLPWLPKSINYLCVARYALTRPRERKLCFWGGGLGIYSTVTNYITKKRRRIKEACVGEETGPAPTYLISCFLTFFSTSVLDTTTVEPSGNQNRISHTIF